MIAAPAFLTSGERGTSYNPPELVGGRDFVTEIMREADQRVKRYLPAREKGARVCSIKVPRVIKR